MNAKHNRHTGESRMHNRHTGESHMPAQHPTRFHSMDNTKPASLVEINSHATRHQLFASLCVLPHFRSIQVHLRPVSLMGSCLVASNSHVWPHWERLLLPGHLSVAVEQDGSAALVLMQQAAVLEVGHKRNFALQAVHTHQDTCPVVPCLGCKWMCSGYRGFRRPATKGELKGCIAMTCRNEEFSYQRNEGGGVCRRGMGFQTGKVRHTPKAMPCRNEAIHADASSGVYRPGTGWQTAGVITHSDGKAVSVSPGCGHS